MDTAPHPGIEKTIPVITLDNDDDGIATIDEIAVVTSGQTGVDVEPDGIIIDSDEDDANSVIVISPGEDRLLEKVVSKAHACNESSVGDLDQDYINFSNAAASVQGNRHLWQLFSARDVAFFNAFSGLPIAAQKLYIQLLNGKYVWRRASSITSEEKKSELTSALKCLIEAQFLVTDFARENTRSLLGLLSERELKDLYECFHLQEDENVNYVEGLMDFAVLQSGAGGEINKNECELRRRITSIMGTTVKLNKSPRRFFLRILLLYSLPESKEMEIDGRTPFLQIMNLVTSKRLRFPSYPWKSPRKIFGGRMAFLRFEEALELEASVKRKVLERSYDSIPFLYNQACDSLKVVLRDRNLRYDAAHLSLALRSFTPGAVYVRTIECCMEPLRTKVLYHEMIRGYQCLLGQLMYLPDQRGKWYDQLAHLYCHHMKSIAEAIEVLTDAMTDKYLSPLDRLILSSRGLKLTSRKPRDYAQMEKNNFLRSMLVRVKPVPMSNLTSRCIRREIGWCYVHGPEVLPSPPFPSVEDVVIYHHRSQGYDKGYKIGEKIGVSLFGILMWDTIYNLDVEDAFISPIQRHPLDLESGEFYLNRREAIERRTRMMEDEWCLTDLTNHVKRIWSEERGKRSIVSWDVFGSVEEVQILLQYIGLNAMAKICRRLAKVYPLAKRGFPTIYVWDSAKKRGKFLAVQQYGEELSPNHVSWLTFLNTAGVDAALCSV